MNDCERVELLFGPYRAPKLHKGGPAYCLFRDCDVIVTSWTDARTSWPRCRAVDAPRGGSGLLVDEELARAIRHESAAAVGYWWGVSSKAVWNWRKALGVSRMKNEGSARLVQAAAEAGADVLRGVPLSPDMIKQRRQWVIDNNLAQYLQPGYHGPRWTKKDERLLGKLPDEEVARRLNRTVEAVKHRRGLLGINKADSNRWTPEEIALLGTIHDADLAKQLGRSLQAVIAKRFSLRIPTRFDRRVKFAPRKRWK